MKYFSSNKAIEMGAIAGVFIASSLVPFVTFKLFQSAFFLEPDGFWRFTPAMAITTIPIKWIIANIIANIIIACVSVVAYMVLNKAIKGSWIRKGFIFGAFAVFLGVYIPVWSMYTIMNLSGLMAISLAIDGTFEYMLYSMLIAFILKKKYEQEN